MAEATRIDGVTREIGRRLRAARSAAGLALTDLAGRTELSEGFLSRLERCQASASIANLVRIADALGLGLHELFANPATPARTEVAVHRDGDAPEEVTSARFHQIYRFQIHPQIHTPDPKFGRIGTRVPSSDRQAASWHNGGQPA